MRNCWSMTKCWSTRLVTLDLYYLHLPTDRFIDWGHLKLNHQSPYFSGEDYTVIYTMTALSSNFPSPTVQVYGQLVGNQSVITTLFGGHFCCWALEEMNMDSNYCTNSLLLLSFSAVPKLAFTKMNTWANYCTNSLLLLSFSAIPNLPFTKLNTWANYCSSSL